MQTALGKQSKDPSNWAYNFVEFLNNFSCRAPLFPNDQGKVVVITDQTTVGQAFKKMIDNHITSIPVIHHSTRAPLYVISLMHFAQYLVTTYKKSDFEDSFLNYMLSIFKDQSSQFLNTSIEELQKNSFYTLDPAFVLEDKETLLKAVELMVRSQTHRVLVVNHIGDIVSVITQSRILELLGSIIDCLPKNDKPIEELGLTKKIVATIHETEIAYNAFKVMTSIMVMGLPVVDDNGTLIGSISISDLKILGKDERNWTLLSKSVRDFMKAVKSANLRSGSLKQLNQEAHVPVVRCHSWHSLGFVIRHLVYFKIHRIYIVNEEMKPIGVVTLTDVLKSLLMDDHVQMEIAEKQKV